MSQFAGLINELPMDPSDDRFFYSIDFVNVIDDGGTLETPIATVSATDVEKGVVISDATISGTKVLFRPSVLSGNQNDAGWASNGDRILITASFQDENGKEIHRSGLLWIAQR